MIRPIRSDSDDDFWSMPPGESIYTHAPEPRSMQTGTAHAVSDQPRRKKQRRIGFRPPAQRQ